VPTLYIVVPCYNEEEVLPETAKRLLVKREQLVASGRCTGGSRIVFVDDGSRDSTWDIIAQLHAEHPVISGVKLAHNRGHQNALLCGLMTVRGLCDCAVSMDADLQDDIEALDDFMDAFIAGNDVVYGVRRRRDTDTVFKRASAQGYYKFLHVLGVDVVYNHADYRLLSRRALDALSEYGEVNLFLRGIVPLIGLRSTEVYYDRHERFAGESKYPLRKMLGLALDGVTSFSVKPIKIISNIGIIISFLSVLGLIYVLVSKFAWPGSTVSGWSAIIASIWLLGGIQLFCIGIIGEYIGKIYSETKARPRYLVEEFLNREK